MADYLIHKSKTSIANTAEWQETDLHYVQNQAAGDILYAADGTHLTRLAKGENRNILVLASGVPAWQMVLDASFADATLSGTPKILKVLDESGTPYYVKVYPTKV